MGMSMPAVWMFFSSNIVLMGEGLDKADRDSRR